MVTVNTTSPKPSVQTWYVCPDKDTGAPYFYITRLPTGNNRAVMQTVDKKREGMWYTTTKPDHDGHFPTAEDAIDYVSTHEGLPFARTFLPLRQ